MAETLRCQNGCEGEAFSVRILRIGGDYEYTLCPACSARMKNELAARWRKLSDGGDLEATLLLLMLMVDYREHERRVRQLSRWSVWLASRQMHPNRWAILRDCITIHAHHARTALQRLA